MDGKIGKQLVFYPSSLWKVEVTRLMRLIAISDHRKLGPNYQLQLGGSKHSPVVLQLSGNFENCPLASKSEMKSDCSLIGLAMLGKSHMIAVGTMGSYDSSSGILILDQKHRFCMNFETQFPRKLVRPWPDCLLQPCMAPSDNTKSMQNVDTNVLVS